ncbi:MAG: MFS transporter, partial [Marmoricola sp.]
VTAVNVALPSIARDLNASPSQLQWVLDAYALAIASLLILSGSVADRIGRRRVFRIGLSIFGVGSVACSLATNPGLLIGARVLQAVGGSMLNPVAMAIVTNTFTDPKERARAIGVWGGTFGLSMALGPVAGGALVSGAGWRSIFWLNVPVVIVALIATTLVVPESRADQPRRFDPVGQALMVVLLGGLTYGIIEGRELGWSSATVIACFAVAALALVAFVGIESRSSQPLIDPQFFRSIPFSGAVVSAIIGFASMGGFLLLNTLYLQQVRGYSALHAGLMTLPMAAATAVASPLSGRWVGNRGPRGPLVAAGIGIAISGALLAQITATTSAVYLGIAYFIFGVGFGLLNPPITQAAVSGMPRSQAGVAAAVASTSRQVGVALGVAVRGAIAFGRLHGPLKTGLATASHASFTVMLVSGVVLAIVGYLVITRQAHGSAERAMAEAA